MRILYIDIDTLRPDHLGCYGYHRNTSPNIDRVAAGGVWFDKCYVSDAPCLPSRASMFTGQFGIHNGAVDHGGTAADVRYIGPNRDFRYHWDRTQWFIPALRYAKYYPVTFSSFASRHSAWWFYAGWREMTDPGKFGDDRAEEVAPASIDWIGRNAKRDNWMLHVHLWDPHTDYRTPAEFGNPFENEPLEGWYTEERRRQQWDSFGPGTPQEPCGAYGNLDPQNPRQPSQIASMADYKKHIDGYDCGIAYADMWVGRILNALADQGVLDDTAVIVTSDHGENQGELGVIGDHALADHITSRVPMILRWPGTKPRIDNALHYQTDIAATLLELAGAAVPNEWDGQSFAPAFRAGQSVGRPYVVFSNMAWSCQRAVRWDDNVFIRTFHTGLKNLPERMLFNVAADPHETNDLCSSQPALADHGQALIEQWTTEMMACSRYPVDPLWTVMSEGGPFHSGLKRLPDYCRRLRATGRAHHAEFLEKNPTGIRR